MPERIAIAGAGTIASGLAAVCAAHGDVLLWARSEASVLRVRASVARHCERHPEETGSAENVHVTTDIKDLAQASFLVEAVVEDVDHKGPLLAELASYTGPEEILATTTSSLSIADLANASGHPDRFVGLHVFNPVTRMPLVELVWAPETREDVRERTRALCRQLDKTAVEVPDTAGFVVNRLLFPYLFDAVNFLVASGMAPVDVDQCMTLGTGMPMGPIALLDFVGLDVAQAIGETIGVKVPERINELVREGALGKKVRRGFYDYS